MKKKLNGMDIFIIVILIGIVAVGGWFLTGNKGQSAQEKDVTVNLMVEFAEQEKDLAEHINIGDEVLIGEKEKANGTVKSVEAPVAKAMGYNNVEGWVKETEIPERYDVQVVIECKGVDTGDTVELNGNAVRVGTNISVKNKNWVGYGTILSVDVTE